MPSRNTIEIVINAKDNASEVIKKLVGNTQSIGKIATAGIVAGFGVATAAVTGFATKGLQEFMKFEQGMQEVFSLLPGISQDAMDDMIVQVENLSMRFGVLPEKTIPALYEALSAGIPQDNVFDFLEIANKAAIAGVTELDTAVNGISSAMNAYGHDVLSAGKASDIMFQTVKFGKTTFEELSNSLYNVSPTAAALGVTFEDLNAQIAAITAQGTPTSVATNQMRQMFVELSKAGGKTAETFQQLAGKTFKQFIAEGGNTQDALQLLEKHAKDTGIGINDLFGSVEAGAAALSLTGNNTERFTGFLEEMANASGSTEEAFKTMSKSLQFQVNRLNAKMSVLYKTIGEKLAPSFARPIEAAGNLVGWFNDLIDGGTSLEDFISYDIPKAFRPFLTVVLKASTVIKDLVSDITRFVGSLKAGIDPLNALFTLLMDFGLSTNTGLAIMGIVNAFADLRGILEFIINPLKAFIKENVKAQDILLALGFAISTVVIPAVIALVVASTPLLLTFGLLVAGAVLLRKAWEKNFLGIRDKVSKALIFVETKLTDLRATLWNTLGDPGDDPVQAFINKFKSLSFIQGLLDKFTKLKDSLLPLFKEIGNALSRIDFGQLFNIGTTLISLTTPLGIIKTLFETIFNVSIFDLFIEGINKVTDLLANLNSGKSLQESLGIEDSSVIGTLINQITGFIGGLIEFIQKQAIPALQAFGRWFLEDALPSVVNFISSTVIPIIQTFIGFIQRIWTDVSPFLQNLANWFLTDVLPLVVNFINTVLIPVFEDIIGWMQQLWTAVSPYLEDLYEWFVEDALPGIINFLENTVTPIISDFIEILKTIWTSVEPIISLLVDWFVTTGLPLVTDFITGTVVPIVEDFIQTLKDIWTAVSPGLESFKNGIRNVFNWIKDNVIQPIINRINEFVQTLRNLGIIQGNTQAAVTSAYNNQNYGSAGFIGAPNIGAQFGSFNGMPYVPRDGMIRKLHQGERVLTKDENQAYSSGQNGNTYNTITLSFPNVSSQEQADNNSKLYVNALRKQGIDI